MAQQNKSGLKSSSTNKFPDNTNGDITPERFRQFHEDVADSVSFLNDTASITGEWTHVGNVNVPLTPSADSHAVSKKYFDDNASTATGDVTGVASSVVDEIPTFSAIDGKQIQAGTGVFLSQFGDFTSVGNITFATANKTLAGIEVGNLLDGSAAQTVDGDWNFTSNITGIAPTLDLHLATKKYVDDNSGSGDVTKVGTPIDGQVGIWTGDGTIEGDANITWDGSSMNLGGGFESSLSNATSGTNDIRVNATSSRLFSDNGSTVDEFELLTTGGGAVLRGYNGSNDDTFEVNATNSSIHLQAEDDLTNNKIIVEATTSALTVTDQINSKGAVYAADYSANYTARSIVDKAYVDSVGGGGGDVTKVGTPVNNEIGVWTGDGTIEGDTNFTWDGSALSITGDITDVATIRQSTSDGSDNSFTSIAGGGSAGTARGAYMNVYGNEHATLAGKLQLNTGDDASATMVFNVAGTTVGEISNAGDWDFQANDLTTTGAVTAGRINIGSPSELTIASGVITITASYHEVDTESDAASDDLETINGGTYGDLLYLRAASSSRTVVVRSGPGNIRLASGADFDLDNNDDTIQLIYTTDDQWQEISSSDNG